MSIQSVAIKIALQGATTTRREADATAKSVKGIGTSAEHTAKKTRLAEVSMRGFAKTTERTHAVIRDVLGATGLAGLALGTGEIVKSAIDAQTAQAKLRATMKASGLASRDYKDAQETIEKQSLRTGFSIAQVSDSFGNFIRTTGSVRKATHLNNVAFNIARTRNIGLANAQSLLARVYNGNFRGLNRLGIQIKAITTRQDLLRASGKKYTLQQMQRAKADDTAATQFAALSLVQQKFAGQSGSYSKTAQGSVDRLKAAVEAIQERIGAVLLPYVAKYAGKLAAFAGKVAKNWPEISQTISRDVDKVKAKLAPLVDWLSANRKPVGEFAGSLAAVGLALKAIHKVGNLTGIAKVAQVAKSPLGRIIGAATRADGTIKHPYYVVVLDKGAGGGGIGSKALSVAKKAAPALGTALKIGGRAGLLTAVLGGEYELARHNWNNNFPTKGSAPVRKAAQGTIAPPGFGSPLGFQRAIPAAIQQAMGSSPTARQILTHGTRQLVGGFPHTIEVPVYINGREVARAVTHAANKQKALK